MSTASHKAELLSTRKRLATLHRLRSNCWGCFFSLVALVTVVVVLELVFSQTGFGVPVPIGSLAPLALVIPIVFAAIYFGFRPAMLVTVLAGLVLIYYFHSGDQPLDLAEKVRFGMFLGVGTLISTLGSMHQNAQIKLSQLNTLTDQRKDDFLAMLGHELRNPLSGISTAARLLVHPALDKRGLTAARVKVVVA